MAINIAETERRLNAAFRRRDLPLFEEIASEAVAFDLAVIEHPTRQYRVVDCHEYPLTLLQGADLVRAPGRWFSQ